MIHSLSGGVIQQIDYYNFAKVLLDNGEPRYYIYNFPLNIGDKVLVPFGRSTQTGVVQKLLQNISARQAPMPIKHMQEIIKKL